ncbi:MAG TPA: DUF1697 domain-containing protein [Candidatus Dormibacteraeota bacterium]|nr:DUF1697 domain-containing protein [Candidatus Dormibacteraeota bacterium]
MPRYVALIRGINLGATNKVPMARLRTAVESLGHTDVTTHIQSGNVIFSSAGRVTSASLETMIASTFGIDTDVMLRTPAQLAKALHANPFPQADQARLHIGFMAARPPAAAVASLDAQRFLPEQFAIRGTELYLHLPAGMGTTKLPAYLGRILKVPTTIRTWRTVGALAEMSE